MSSDETREDENDGVFSLHVFEANGGDYSSHVFENDVSSLYVHEDDDGVCFVVQVPRLGGSTFDLKRDFLK
jgi:hypothetical protein